MIKLITTEEIQLTREYRTAFGGVLDEVLPVGTEVTWWMTEPKTIGKGVGMAWKIGMVGWIGDYTQKDTAPVLNVKEVQSNYKVDLFNTDGTYKYPFVRSEKEYVSAMIEDQSRLLVQFFYVNGIFPEGSLDIVGV
jgi:hypothetical protein